MEQEMEQVFERYIAMDGHKEYVVIGGINAQLERVLLQGRMPFEKCAPWAREHLRQTDAVVVEASTNTWVVYDLSAPLVGQVVVVHPPTGGR